jgi:hypothetical protein
MVRMRWALDSHTEYDCIRDAVQLGLEALEIRPTVDAIDLKEAFCYVRRGVIESCP